MLLGPDFHSDTPSRIGMGPGGQCRQVMLPIIAICYPMIANPRVKTHGCYKANPMNGVKTKNHNLPNFFDPVLTGWYLSSRVCVFKEHD